MLKILDSNLKVIATSKNLAGIVNRSRKVTPERVDVYLDHNTGTGQLGVTWVDESFTITDFASSSVLMTYIANARWKRGARVVTHSKGSIQ